MALEFTPEDLKRNRSMTADSAQQQLAPSTKEAKKGNGDQKEKKGGWFGRKHAIHIEGDIVEPQEGDMQIKGPLRRFLGAEPKYYHRGAWVSQGEYASAKQQEAASKGAGDSEDRGAGAVKGRAKEGRLPPWRLRAQAMTAAPTERSKRG